MSQILLRKRGKWAIGLACLLAVGLFVYHRASRESTALISPLRSGISPDEARQILRLPLERWIVTSGARYSSVEVSNYVDCNVTGTLILDFRNDRLSPGRLSQTTFYPSDYQRYLREKRVRFGRVDEFLSLLPFRYTRVWVGPDYQGRDYVTWQDSEDSDRD